MICRDGLTAVIAWRGRSSVVVVEDVHTRGGHVEVARCSYVPGIPQAVCITRREPAAFGRGHIWRIYGFGATREESMTREEYAAYTAAGRPRDRLTGRAAHLDATTTAVLDRAARMATAGTLPASGVRQTAHGWEFTCPLCASSSREHRSRKGAEAPWETHLNTCPVLR